MVKRQRKSCLTPPRRHSSFGAAAAFSADRDAAYKPAPTTMTAGEKADEVEAAELAAGGKTAGVSLAPTFGSAAMRSD